MQSMLQSLSANPELAQQVGLVSQVFLVRLALCGEFSLYRGTRMAWPVREPVWPSGKALGWQAKGPRFDTASALLSLQKGCGLWTLSCDFVHHFLLKH